MHIIAYYSELYLWIKVIREFISVESIKLSLALAKFSDVRKLVLVFYFAQN